MHLITTEEAYKRASELINQSHDGGGAVGDDIQLRFYVDAIWAENAELKRRVEEAENKVCAAKEFLRVYDEQDSLTGPALLTWSDRAEAADKALRKTLTGEKECPHKAGYDNAKKEIENLTWNLAGCDCYANGWADPVEGHAKELERPALISVRKMALQKKELETKLQAAEEEKDQALQTANDFHKLTKELGSALASKSAALERIKFRARKVYNGDLKLTAWSLADYIIQVLEAEDAKAPAPSEKAKDTQERDEAQDREDIANKIDCLVGYLKMFVEGRTSLSDLENIKGTIREAEEFSDGIRALKSQEER